MNTDKQTTTTASAQPENGAEEWSHWLATYKEGDKSGAERFYDAFMFNAQNAEGTCVHCNEPIYLDIREGGGVPDWRTIDGDYGCDNSPEGTDDACGGHTPRKGHFKP